MTSIPGSVNSSASVCEADISASTVSDTSAPGNRASGNVCAAGTAGRTATDDNIAGGSDSGSSAAADSNAGDGSQGQTVSPSSFKVAGEVRICQAARPWAKSYAGKSSYATTAESSDDSAQSNALCLPLTTVQPVRPARALGICPVVNENGTYHIHMKLNEALIVNMALKEGGHEEEDEEQTRLMGSELNALIEEAAARRATDEQSPLKVISLKINDMFCGRCSTGAYDPDTGMRQVVWEFPDNSHFLQNQKLPFLRQYDLVSLQLDITLDDDRRCHLYSPWLICTGRFQRDNDNLREMIATLSTKAQSPALELMFPEIKYTGRGPEDCISNGMPEYPAFYGYTRLTRHICDVCQQNLTSLVQMLQLSELKNKRSAHSIAAAALASACAQDDTAGADNAQPDAASDSTDSASNGADNSALADACHEIMCFVFSVLTVSRNNLKAVAQYRLKEEASETSNGACNGDDSDTGGDACTGDGSASAADDTDSTEADGRYMENTGASAEALNSPYAIVERLRNETFSADIAILESAVLRLEKILDTLEQATGSQPALMYKIPACRPAYTQVEACSRIYRLMDQWFTGYEVACTPVPVIHERSTIDRIFEYYCLYTILSMLMEQGFKADIYTPSWRYEYLLHQKNNEPDYSTANTYRLFKYRTVINLYYQPVISGSYFENGLPLFRTDNNGSTTGSNGADLNFFNPDFVMRVTRSSDNWANKLNDDYVVLDSKYSRANNIIRNYLPDLINKYVINMTSAVTSKQPQPPVERYNSIPPGTVLKTVQDEHKVIFKDINDTRPISMVIALQGRVESRTVDPLKAVTMAKHGNNEFKESIFDIMDKVSLNKDSSTSGASVSQAGSGTDEKDSLHGPVWIKHSSPLAQIFAPPSAGAVVEINSIQKSTELLWNTITATLTYLKPEPPQTQEISSDKEPASEKEPASDK